MREHRDLRPFLTYNARAFSGAPTDRSMNPEETKPDITRGRAYMAAVIMVGHMDEAPVQLRLLEADSP